MRGETIFQAAFGLPVLILWLRMMGELVLPHRSL